MVPHLVRAAQSSYNLKRYNYSHFITHTHTHRAGKAASTTTRRRDECLPDRQSVSTAPCQYNRPCHGSAVTAWRIASGQKISHYVQVVAVKCR